MKTLKQMLKNTLNLPATVLAGMVLCGGCSFAPSYHKPDAAAPTAFKEMTPAEATRTDGWKTNDWKQAEPQDAVIKGKWWEMFNQPELNALEEQVNITNNQTLAAAFENFLIARDVTTETRSQLFPTVSAAPNVNLSRSNLRTPSRSGTNSFGAVTTSTIMNYALPLDASWEVDLWGSIRNSVKANSLEAQATIADLVNMRLSIQGEVALDYFQLRELDSQKKLLDETVGAYRDSLDLTKTLHETGIASDQDVAQAETILDTTLAQATDVGIQRAQLEHAIATLIGKPASDFSITNHPLDAKPIAIPYGVPSKLLERRPDIAAAERRVAEANAQIGVARAAYFPTVNLSGDIGFDGERIGSLSSGPALAWSVGATAVETIFDAGRRRAVTKQSWAQYRVQVADYRQTVLSAIQDVEDNLVALRLLSTELKQQDDAVAASLRYLNLAKDRYRLGIDSYLNVITAQTTLLGNQRTQLNLQVEQMTSSVQLIEGLGGGWDGQLTETAAAK